MKNVNVSIKLLVLFVLIVTSCSEEREFNEMEINDLNPAISVQSTEGTRITYKIDSFEEASELVGQTLTFDGQTFYVIEKTAFNSQSKNGRTSVDHGTEIFLASGYPSNGDILVSASVIEFVSGTVDHGSGTFSCPSSDCIEESVSIVDFGAPNLVHTAYWTYRDGNKNNIHFASSFIDRYIGSSTTYEPGQWERIKSGRSTKIPSGGSCPSYADPYATSKAQSTPTSKTVYNYIGCDD